MSVLVKVSSLFYAGVVVGFFSFLLSAGRLLNWFIVVENLRFLLVMFVALSCKGVLYFALIVMFTLESALALVVLFRL